MSGREPPHVVPRRYQKRGFVFGYISHYEGMETGEIVARVVEGRVNKVGVVHVDDEGNPRKDAGEVAPDVILRELPFKVRMKPLPVCLTFRHEAGTVCLSSSATDIKCKHGSTCARAEDKVVSTGVCGSLIDGRLSCSQGSCTMLRTGGRR